MFPSEKKLSDEEQLTILRQRPEFVRDDKLQFVNLVTDLVHLRCYGVVVSDGLEMLVLDAVSHLTSLNQFLYARLDKLCALCYLLNDLLVTRSELVSLILGEDVVHALYVLGELALIVSADRDDMVHRAVAEYACLILNLHGVSLPLRYGPQAPCVS